MQCRYCGFELDGDEESCPRCGADPSPSALRHHALMTLLLIVISVTVATICIYYVLSWHELQHPMGR